MAMKDLAQVVIQSKDETGPGIASAREGINRFGDEVVSGIKTKLAALTGLLSLGALGHLVESIMHQVAALHDLQEAYGASIENLTALREAHRMAGVEFDVLGGVLGKLSKNLVASLDPTSNQAEALRALGISAVDAAGKLKKPDEILMELGQRLPQYADGTQKVAALQALLGKEAAKYIPVLNELVAAEEFKVRLTDAQVASADQLVKNQVRLGAANRALTTTIVAGLAPVFNDLINSMLDGQKNSEGLRGTLLSMAKDGTFAEWLRSITMGVAYGIDGFQYLWRLLQSFAIPVGAFMASMESVGEMLRGVALVMAGKWVEGSAYITNSLNTMKAGFAGAANDIRAAWNQPLFSDSVAQALYGVGKAATKAGGDLEVNYTAGANAAAKKMSEFMKSLSELQAKLDGFDAGLEADFTKNMGILQHALIFGKLSADEYGKAVATLIKQQPVWKANAKDIAAAESAIAKEDEDLAKEIEALLKIGDDRVRQITSENEKIKQELEMVGMTRQERELYVLSKQRDIAISGPLTDTRRKEIEQLFEQRRALIQLRTEAEEWLAVRNQLADGLTDAIMRGFENSKGFLRSFRDWLINTFKTMVLRPVIKPLMDAGAGMILQLLGRGGGGGITSGGANGVGGLGSLGGVLNLGSSIASGYNFLMGTGTVGTALGQTAIGQFLGGATGAIQGPGLTGGAALGQQFAGTMSNILPVLSYFAIAIAGAAVAAHQFAAGWRIDGNGGYRTNNPVAPLFMATQMDRTYRALGFNDQWAAILSGSSMATRMFGRRARQNDAMGVRGVIDPAGVTGTNWQDWSEQGGWFTSTRRGTYDASNNPAMAFDSEQRQFFVSMMAPVTAMVARVSARYGVDSASALSGYSRSFDLQLNENGNPLSDERISQLFTDLFVGVMQDQVAIILQEAGQTDLAMYVRGITGTGQEIASMIQTIMDFLSATDHLDPETILSDSSRSAIQMYRLQGEELLKLARNTNLSTESLGQLITATGQYRNVAAQLILQFQQARETVGGTIEGAIRDIRFSVLDRQGQYNFLQQEAAQLAGGINSMDDANAIIAAVNQATQLSNQAFGMLSEDERRAKAEEFIRGLEDLRKAADDRLKELQDKVVNDANRQLDEIRDIVKELTRQSNEAATRQVEAANSQVSAANTFSSAVRNGIDIRIGVNGGQLEGGGAA